MSCNGHGQGNNLSSMISPALVMQPQISLTDLKQKASNGVY